MATIPYKRETVSATDGKNCLDRIAEALGEPQSAFVDGGTLASKLDDTCEMLRIWDSLESAADRQKLLAFARNLGKARLRD